MYQNSLDSIDITPGQVFSIPAPPLIIGQGQSLQSILAQKNISQKAPFQIVDKHSKGAAIQSKRVAVVSACEEDPRKKRAKEEDK